MHTYSVIQIQKRAMYTYTALQRSREKKLGAFDFDVRLASWFSLPPLLERHDHATLYCRLRKSTNRRSGVPLKRSVLLEGRRLVKLHPHHTTMNAQ